MKKYKWPIEDLEESLLKSVLVSYSDHLDEHGHVAVTAWNNGEGFDVDINDIGRFGMTYSQWEALKLAMKKVMALESGLSKDENHGKIEQ